MEGDRIQKRKTPFLNELFSKNEVTPGAIPAGMDALFRILLCKTDDLFTPYWRSDVLYEENTPCACNYTLDRKLGMGSFGTAFSVHGDSNMVVKAFQGSNAHEIEALRALRNASSRCENIPVFLNKGCLAISIRGSRQNLPALRMSPVGSPIDLLYKSADNKTQLLAVAKDVRAALDFAHAISWYHLDVQPSNIVLVMEDHTRLKRAILIDWGLSSSRTQSVTGFRGSLLYAHDELFCNIGTETKWTPGSKHDWASLVYALVVMKKRGNVPWCPYRTYTSDDDCYSEYLEIRKTTAEKVFADMSVDLRDKMAVLLQS